jgi:putative transposase
VKPTRRISPPGTYFITTNTVGRRALFLAERLPAIWIDTLFDYRNQGNYRIHEFVLMPEHFHLLITPAEHVSLEKALQLVKGGSSFRFKAGAGFNGEVWQRGFIDHRIRDEFDYLEHRKYILENPVRRGLVLAPNEYRFSSAAQEFRAKIDAWTSAAKAAELVEA